MMIHNFCYKHFIINLETTLEKLTISGTLLIFNYIDVSTGHFSVLIRRHGSVSALKCMRDEMHTVYLYASRRVASTRDYRISIMAEPMKFWLGAIDSLGSNCIIKVFSFFLYVPYERRYCDAKFESGNFLFKKRRHCHRRPILCCTVATSDARGGTDLAVLNDISHMW